MFENFQSKVGRTLQFLKGSARLKQSDIDQALVTLKESFLEADVDYDVTLRFLENLKTKALGQKISESLTPYQAFIKILYLEMVALFGDERSFDFQGKPPHVVLMAGLQGAGKTTTSAKLAVYCRKKLKRKPLLVSVDTTRPAAIEQLERLAQDANIDFFKSSSTNPLERADGALKYAATYGLDIVIVDTAGRLSISEPLMEELVSLEQALHPKHTFYVADAMSGQQGLKVARGFCDRVKVTGAILTKTDGDTRGGVAFSLREALGVPLQFVGTGEKLEGLDVFHPKRWVSRILDLGDLESFVEKAQDAFEGQAPKEDQMKRLAKGNFTFLDFQEQMKMVSKLGSLGGLMGMIPGMGAMASKINQQDVDKKLKRINAMIDSMTKKERLDPDLLNGDRKRRIALGSGTKVEEINQFLREFTEMQKMMKQLSGKGMKGLARMMGR